MDLSAFGGERTGRSSAAIVQELELPSARVLFEWRSLDHVALEETHAARRGIASTTSTSTRSTSTATATCSSRPATRGPSTRSSRKTGEVLWRLGGKQSDFAMGAGHRRSRGSTTRATTRRPADQHLRRRRRARGRAAVARARDRARPARTPGDARPQVHAPAGGASRTSWATRRLLDNGNVARRLGQRAVRHGVRARRRDPLRREAARTAARTTARSASRGSAGPRDRRGSSCAGPRRRKLVRELERRDRGRVVAAPGRPVPRVAERRRHGPRTGFETRSTSRRARRTSPRSRSRHTASRSGSPRSFGCEAGGPGRPGPPARSQAFFPATSCSS